MAAAADAVCPAALGNPDDAGHIHPVPLASIYTHPVTSASMYTVYASIHTVDVSIYRIAEPRNPARTPTEKAVGVWLTNPTGHLWRDKWTTLRVDLTARWCSRLSMLQPFERNVTKFSPHKALNLIYEVVLTALTPAGERLDVHPWSQRRVLGGCPGQLGRPHAGAVACLGRQ